jgi:hypothetical protein
MQESGGRAGQTKKEGSSAGGRQHTSREPSLATRAFSGESKWLPLVLLSMGLADTCHPECCSSRSWDGRTSTQAVGLVQCPLLCAWIVREGQQPVEIRSRPP